MLSIDVPKQMTFDTQTGDDETHFWKFFAKDECNSFDLTISKWGGQEQRGGGGKEMFNIFILSLAHHCFSLRFLILQNMFLKKAKFAKSKK